MIRVESQATKDRQRRKRLSRLVSWFFPFFLLVMGAVRLVNAGTGLGDSFEAEVFGGSMLVVMAVLFMPFNLMPKGFRLRVTDFRSMLFFLCIMAATMVIVQILA